MQDSEFLTQGKIDISEEVIEFWSKKFNCKKEDLIKAVNKIGSRHNILLCYLEMNRLIIEDEE